MAVFKQDQARSMNHRIRDLEQSMVNVHGQNIKLKAQIQQVGLTVMALEARMENLKCVKS